MSDPTLQELPVPLGPISSEIDSMLEEMYKALDDPNYQGDSTEILRSAVELLEREEREVKAMIDPEGVPERDLDLFPEGTGLDTAAVSPPEPLNARLPSASSGSAYLQRLMNHKSIPSLLSQDPSFSVVLERANSLLEKPIDFRARESTGEPQVTPSDGVRKEHGRWLRAPPRVDSQPRRLGPTGTWINDDVETEESRITMQRGDTLTLGREDTLTD